jgi:aprataxin and PNK-like factor
MKTYKLLYCRLNAEHKAMFSHPGDSDYDLPDSRPECIYGIKCYRKNPQHKIEYKHTCNKRKPGRITLKPVSPEDFSDWEDSEEESVDESEYEPSFIDDESIESSEHDFSEEKL